MTQPALLADVGGTHARFALRLPDGTISAPIDLPSDGFRTLEEAAREGLSRHWKSLSSHFELREAAIAAAGPVTSDRVELTNVAWSFSIEETRRALGFDRLLVVNDVAALAWAIPELERRGGGGRLGESTAAREEDGKAFSDGRDQGQDPDRIGLVDPSISVSAVVAVGTGLGVATLARPGGGEMVLASEGGHRDLAAATEREWAVVSRLASRFGGHVSVERAVSGSGLSNLWQALAELDGESIDGGEGVPAPDEVTKRALAGESRALEVTSLFSGWLGAVCGDVALTVGARGGLWLGGGVLGKMGAMVDRERFLERFLAKGRFEAWMRSVPVYEIDDDLAAYRGLARALDAAGRRNE